MSSLTMSDEDVTLGSGPETQMVTAEYKDGQLQIVEVTPFDKGDKTDSHMMPDLSSSGDDQPKYMQILNTDKGLVQLDLLNLTLVRCDDGEESYQLVANAQPSVAGEPSDTTVTCVLQSSDNEDTDNQDSFVVVNTENGEEPLVFLKSTLQQINAQKKEILRPNKPLTPSEILEKAKALQKAKTFLAQTSPAKTRGRKRKSDLPPPHELLASPNFKLFLYSCKMCSFKCNAVKDMTAHKAAEHGSGRIRAGNRSVAVTLQCARCPYRGNTHTQLMKHVQDKHFSEQPTHAVELNSSEVEAADVLVCGACGFESSSRQVFRKHIEELHGATATL